MNVWTCHIIAVADLLPADRLVFGSDAQSFAGPPVTELVDHGHGYLAIKTVNGGSQSKRANHKVEILRPDDDTTPEAWVATCDWKRS